MVHMKLIKSTILQYKRNLNRHDFILQLKTKKTEMMEERALVTNITRWKCLPCLIQINEANRESQFKNGQKA